MKHRFWASIALPLAALTFASGCATTKARRAQTADASSQVTQLQQELVAKDQQIQDLQYQLDSVQRSLPSGTPTSGSRAAAIKVSGVTVEMVQKALMREGFDPGPVDGRLGKKTKAAIKQFQRQHQLRADGVVGERTWALLKS